MPSEANTITILVNQNSITTGAVYAIAYHGSVDKNHDFTDNGLTRSTKLEEAIRGGGAGEEKEGGARP